MEESEYRIEEQVQAGHWWFVGRRRLLRDVLSAIRRKSGVVSFGTMLDVGCGVGNQMEVLRDFSSHVVGVDADPHACAYAKNKGYAEVVESAAEELSARMPRASSDVVIMMDVLEHLEHDTIGAKAAWDVLKPGGWLIVTVPAFMSLWGIQDQLGHHYRRYRLPQICAVLKSVGFSIERRTYFNTVLFLPILIMRQWWRRRPAAKQPRSENAWTSPFANRVLKGIFLAEIAGLRIGWRYPFGVSALVVAQKPPMP